MRINKGLSSLCIALLTMLPASAQIIYKSLFLEEL
jgi:hypothetical protein